MKTMKMAMMSSSFASLCSWGCGRHKCNKLQNESAKDENIIMKFLI
jgi:hypothetical protein